MAEQKEQIMARLKDRLGVLLPVIENIRHPLAAQPKVRFYHGIEGIKEVFEESIRVPGEPIYAVADAAFSLSEESRDLADFILKYITRRIDRDCWYYGICNKSQKTDRVMKSSKNAKRSVRMVENLPLPIELLIFRDRVAVVSLRGQFFGLMIEDQQIADTSKAIHQAISKVLPPYATSASAVSPR